MAHMFDSGDFPRTSMLQSGKTFFFKAYLSCVSSQNETLYKLIYSILIYFEGSTMVDPASNLELDCYLYRCIATSSLYHLHGHGRQNAVSGPDLSQRKVGSTNPTRLTVIKRPCGVMPATIATNGPLQLLPKHTPLEVNATQQKLPHTGPTSS